MDNENTAGSHYHRVSHTISELTRKFEDLTGSLREWEESIRQETTRERQTLAKVTEVLNRSTSLDEASRLILNAINIGFDVEKCSVMTFGDAGKVKMKGYFGLTAKEAQAVKEYMSTAFSIPVDPGAPFEDKEESLEIVQVKQRLRQGEPFVAQGSGEVKEDFLVIPLKAANTIRGALTINKVRGMEVWDEKVQKLFSVIGATMAPYFYIGLYLEEKRSMKTSPYNSFLELIEESIGKVKEYNGWVTLVIIKVNNYSDLCDRLGIDEASHRIRNMGAALSSRIDKFHEATRITEIKLAVILPMIDRIEASEIIAQAIEEEAEKDISLQFKVVQYPEDGTTPEQLMFLSYL